MSSILRALKKLDEDAAELESQGSAEQLKMKQMVHRRAKEPGKLFRYISIVSVIFLLGLVGWLLLKSPGDFPPPETDEKAKTVTSPTNPTPEHSTPKKQAETAPAVLNKQQPNKNNTHTQKTGAKEPRAEAPTAELTQWPQTEQPKTNSPRPKTRRIKRPDLKLSGIIWSQTPERRQAMINGDHVKEGDKIKGVTIIKIEKNGVTLKSGSDTWNIRM